MGQQRLPGRPVEAVAGGRVGSDHGAIANVDSQIVSAHWRWLHAVWEEDVDQVERARAAVDVLLERRFEIMQAAAAAAVA